MSGFEPSLLCFCVFFPRCFPFFSCVDGGGVIATAPVLLVFIPYPKITCFWLSMLPNVWRTFFVPLL